MREGSLSQGTSRLENLNIVSDVDGSDQPYALYLPRRWNRKKAYPLVVSLHGAGTNHRINMRRVLGLESDPECAGAFADWHLPIKCPNHIVVCPFARGSMGYQGIAERDVYQVLADVQKRQHIDPDRIYLTGLSMGGGGALWLGLTRPDVWAAVAAVAPKCVLPMTWELAPNALNLPIRFFQGARDLRSCVEHTRTLVKRLRDLKTEVIDYTEYPEVGIPSWENAYKEGAVFDWFQQFRRNRYPLKVRFQSTCYKYGSAYWVRFTRLESGVLAKIDAEFVGSNDIEVTTEELSCFALNLDGHPLYSREYPLHITIDGEEHWTKDLSFNKEGRRWKIGQAERLSGQKGLGSEGPICEAFAGRHVYVFGTADNPSPEQLEGRRSQAAIAAGWKNAAWQLILGSLLSSVAPPDVFFPVISDRQAARSEYRRHNLILFGNGKTNSVIAGLAERLPIELRPDAADYGLIFVQFIDGRYVVVNSGTPWWTGANPSKRSGFAFLSLEHGVLNTFPDFLLFKGSLDNVIVEGWFDENWALTSRDIAKINHDGACVIPERRTPVSVHAESLQTARE